MLDISSYSASESKESIKLLSSVICLGVRRFALLTSFWSYGVSILLYCSWLKSSAVTSKSWHTKFFPECILDYLFEREVK